MKWIHFTLDTHVDAVDALSYMLAEAGVEGIQIEDNMPLGEEDKKKMFVDILPEPDGSDKTAKIHFYMEPETCNPEQMKFQVDNILSEISRYCEVGEGTLSVSETEDKDWINNWKQFFKPFRASGSIVIKPTWEEYEKEKESDILLEIDPGVAFGTGSHETTKLCIQALDKYVREGDSVLDVGCGSGILSIAALKLGAAHAAAIDIDETAVRVARENMSVNQIPADRYSLFEGDLLGHTDNPRSATSAVSSKNIHMRAGMGHDIVVANILADVIVPLTAVIRPHLKQGGLYITSGIIDTKEEEVRAALEDAGFEILSVEEMKEWRCFIAKA